MAKKQKEQETEQDYGMDTGYSIAEDFNIDEEFKPSPMVPSGVYHAAVTSVSFNPGDQTIDWMFTLNNNGGVMSDGETPIDGACFKYRNWLPRKGDENEMTSDGRQTKRSAKISMLKGFSDALNIDMSTPVVILESIANQEWVGMDVGVKIRIREFEGRVFNDVERVVPE
jgi:hypothetical protein